MSNKQRHDTSTSTNGSPRTINTTDKEIQKLKKAIRRITGGDSHSSGTTKSIFNEKTVKNNHSGSNGHESVREKRSECINPESAYDSSDDMHPDNNDIYVELAFVGGVLVYIIFKTTEGIFKYIISEGKRLWQKEDKSRKNTDRNIQP